jgi:NAD+ synthase (glutamine-hydrolysing)
MAGKARVAVAQINTTVGDLSGNVRKIVEGIRRAHELRADIVVFPEMAVPGYPVEDLVYKPDFLDANLRAMEEIARETAGLSPMAVVGFIARDTDISNAAAVAYNGRIVDVTSKVHLPNYGVFDEVRYFTPGASVPVYLFRGLRIGVNICEDAWYPTGPIHAQATHGDAEIVINISASPFHAGKQEYRENMYAARAGDEAVILVNCNLAGGQDELVFDGASTAWDQNGRILARLSSFTEDFRCFDVDTGAVFRKRLKDIRRRHERGTGKPGIALREVEVAPNAPSAADGSMKPAISVLPSFEESVYTALKLGVADYARKNGFRNVIVAVSGGIDSAVVAAVAVDALGADRVKGIYLPSRFSADISGEDARQLAENLGFELFELPIQPTFEGYRQLMSGIFRDLPFNIAEENLQSRIRGNIVMALSNKFNWLVLTTGNKSEMSTGYATLYGDMAGGFAVIKDVLKTVVYRITGWRNAQSPVIPERIVTRPPSAELREDQKDSDSLPEYPVLDRIIAAYVEEDVPVEDIISEIGNEALVRRVVRMIDLAEYKRRQSPPGIKISPRAFGRDRRMPITNSYRP